MAKSKNIKVSGAREIKVLWRNGIFHLIFYYITFRNTHINKNLTFSHITRIHCATEQVKSFVMIGMSLGL